MENITSKNTNRSLRNTNADKLLYRSVT